MPLLAISAVFIGLWLTGIELNISAMMGMTMIVGIVTEVAIFYFSELQELREQRTRELHAALHEAGEHRMRPILMSTLAAILTLLPLALAHRPGLADAAAAGDRDHLRHAGAAAAGAAGDAGAVFAAAPARQGGAEPR